jgi:hypothetical protein
MKAPNEVPATIRLKSLGWVVEAMAAEFGWASGRRWRGRRRAVRGRGNKPVAPAME